MFWPSQIMPLGPSQIMVYVMILIGVNSMTILLLVLEGRGARVWHCTFGILVIDGGPVDGLSV